MEEGFDVKGKKEMIDMKARYLRAEKLMQGPFTKNVAFNATLIPHWINSSDCFWYEREFKDGKEFRLIDASKGSNKSAFDHEVLAAQLKEYYGKGVASTDLPIFELDFSDDMASVIFTAYGERWKFDGSKILRSISGQADSDHLVSPDGKKTAFVENHNIWILDLASGKKYELTNDGESHYSYGSTPSSWGVKHGTKIDAVWSPDSSCLLTLQLDMRKVKTLPIIHHAPRNENKRPVVTGIDRRVAFPGDEYIDEYRFLAINVETGYQQEVDYRRCPVFRNASGFFIHGFGWWSEDSRLAYFIDLERRGDHLARLVEFDSQNGASRILIEEACADTCFKLRLDSRMPIHARPLENSNDLIWYSERSGWGHLYLYDAKTGALKNPITQGDWIVRDIHHYDSRRRELIIQTAGRVADRHAYYRDICRVNIDTGELIPVVSTDHEYVIFDEGNELSVNLAVSRDVVGAKGISPNGNYLVTTRSRADNCPVSLLLDREGNEVLTLETADISGLPEGWQWPEPVKLQAADGETDIFGVVYRPSNFSTDELYPVLDVSMTMQEGNFLPAGSFTNNNIAGYLYLVPAALAELGFIVVDIYGRGTSSRDKAFVNADLDPKLPFSKNLSDRVAGIRQLAKRYPYMDLNRVGAGGVVSTTVAFSSLLGEPDFYKVGVTNGAGFDNELAPAFYGESYGDLPASADIRPSFQTYAKNLKGKLLLMHGMLHPSVPVAQTFRLIDALQQANKDFDMLLLPNDGYGMCSYAMRRCWDYLVRHLMGVEPPEEFELTTSQDLVIKMKAEQAAAANK